MTDHADGQPGLAQTAMDAVTDGRVKFFPEMVSIDYWIGSARMRDWCISRQLWWDIDTDLSKRVKDHLLRTNLITSVFDKTLGLGGSSIIFLTQKLAGGGMRGMSICCSCA